MSDLPVSPPVVTPETERFWAGTAEGKLLLPRCDDCSTLIWYPREVCPECRSQNVSWIEASGRGTVYSFSVVHRGGGPWRAVLPYVLAYVELEEGPRVMTNVVDVDPSSVEVGQRVEVVFDDTGVGAALVRFRPV